MKKNKLPLLLLLPLLVFSMVGCGSIQRALFTPQPVTVLVTNAAPTIISNGVVSPQADIVTRQAVTNLAPNPVVTELARQAGAAAGPYGSIAAGLFTSALALFASWHNRKALAQHVENTTKT